MNRRVVGLGFFTLLSHLLLGTRRAISWSLVSQEEAQAEKSASPPEAAQSGAGKPNAPSIEVVEPDLNKPIKSPFDIRIVFHVQSDASIDPSTFHARYGWLGVDITDRLVGHAKINASGISARGAEIPAGKYRLSLQIADTVGRVGMRSFDFTMV